MILYSIDECITKLVRRRNNNKHLDDVNFMIIYGLEGDIMSSKLKFKFKYYIKNCIENL